MPLILDCHVHTKAQKLYCAITLLPASFLVKFFHIGTNLFWQFSFLMLPKRQFKDFIFIYLCFSVYMFCLSVFNCLCSFYIILSWNYLWVLCLCHFCLFYPRTHRLTYIIRGAIDPMANKKLDMGSINPGTWKPGHHTQVQMEHKTQ